MAKFTLYARTNKVGSQCEQDFEVPDEDLEGLNDEARQKLIDDYANDYLANIVEWGVRSSGPGPHAVGTAAWTQACRRFFPRVGSIAALVSRIHAGRPRDGVAVIIRVTG